MNFSNFNEFGTEQDSWNFVTFMMFSEGADTCFRQFAIARSVWSDPKFKKLERAYVKSAEALDDVAITDPSFIELQQKFNIATGAIEQYVCSKADSAVLDQIKTHFGVEE
jgi:hypothetical protein